MDKKGDKGFNSPMEDSACFSATADCAGPDIASFVAVDTTEGALLKGTALDQLGVLLYPHCQIHRLHP